MAEQRVCVICGRKGSNFKLTMYEDKLYCSEHLDLIEAGNVLMQKFPDQEFFKIYTLDKIERLLMNSQTQTQYLNSIKTTLNTVLILTLVGMLLVFVLSIGINQ